MKYIILSIFAMSLFGCNRSFPEYKYFNQAPAVKSEKPETKSVKEIDPNDNTEKSYTEIFTVETP